MKLVAKTKIPLCMSQITYTPDILNFKNLTQSE